jgi:hypothetical protein
VPFHQLRTHQTVWSGPGSNCRPSAFKESDVRPPASSRSECSRPTSSSLLDCLGRGRWVKAKPHTVASRALTQRPRPEGRQLSRRTGEEQGTAISTGRTTVRRAISRPLTAVTSGLSRSTADTPSRRLGHVTGPDGTASQADSSRLQSHDGHIASRGRRC